MSTWQLTKKGVNNIRKKNLHANQANEMMSLIMNCIRWSPSSPSLIEIAEQTGIMSTYVKILIGELWRHGDISWISPTDKQKRYRLTNKENFDLFK